MTGVGCGGAASTMGLVTAFGGGEGRAVWVSATSSVTISDAANMSLIASASRCRSRATASNVASPVWPSPAFKLMPASMRFSSAFHSRSAVIISQERDVEWPSGYSSFINLRGSAIFSRTAK